MKIDWGIESCDIERLHAHVHQHENIFVKIRNLRNINRQGLNLDKNSILKAMIMCLLTSQQRSGPHSRITKFLTLKDFPITIENLNKGSNIEYFVKSTLQENGLNRYINRIPNFFVQNYQYLESSNWEILQLLSKLNVNSTKSDERIIADHIDEKFIGFGPKQARNFLQSLGLTKYEIPIDSRITSWLNNFGFPIILSSGSLQDKNYYHFISDGIQELCYRANVFPCILDAAIFSSSDNGEWTEENMVY